MQLDPKLTLARAGAARQEGCTQAKRPKKPDWKRPEASPSVPNKHHVARCWTWKPGIEIRPEPTQHRLHERTPGGVYVCQRDPRPLWRAPFGGPGWERQTGVVRAVVHLAASPGSGCQVLKIPPDRVIVIHDEMDVPYGRLKLQNAGGHGGHNGLRSIIVTPAPRTSFAYASASVAPPKWDPPLRPWQLRHQRATGFAHAYRRSNRSVLTIIRDGLPKAMNTYNRRDP